MSDLLEALMIVCFGLSWPVSIYKSYTSRTAKGKSLFFEVFIWIGYVFVIGRKTVLPETFESFLKITDEGKIVIEALYGDE